MNNQIKVINYILKNKTSTRNTLVEHLSISKMGVSKIVTGLLNKNLVTQKKEEKSNKPGPKNYILSINTAFFTHILTIYFGLDKIIFSVFDLDGKEKFTDTIQIDLNKTILNLTFEKIKEILRQYNIMIIGIGMNGIVDSKKGIVKISTYYHWQNLNLKEIIEKEFGITVIIENGVNLIAYSEMENYRNETIVILNIANGVGSTIVKYDFKKDKVEFETKEIGHIPFDFSENALICVCGNKGCVETIMADWRITERLNKKYNETLTYDEIILKANKNEGQYRTDILEILVPLSSIILWFDTLIKMDRIIINGKITFLDNFFWQELNRILKSRILIKNKKIEISKCQYQENIILKGAFKYCIKNLTNTLYFQNILKESE